MTTDDWKLGARRKLAMLQNQHAAHFSAHAVVTEKRRELRAEIAVASSYVDDLLRGGAVSETFLQRAKRDHARAVENLANFEETLPDTLPHFNQRRTGEAFAIADLLNLWS